jgi:(1->4)-alpha-D-glucan 1-alpha-D-glucosylmutase
MHGYDIIDHHHLNPEIGTAEDYERLVAVLHEHGMRQILDIVPNHMGVMGSDNAWWLDVLENGESSAYAEFFDIDWEPLKDELQGKVLVPVLGDQYGTVLDRGELKLNFDAEKGEFSIWYFQHRFPANPREYPRILIPAAEQLKARSDATDDDLLELQSLISAFGHLPGRSETSPDKRAERIRDKEIHKRRLAALCARSHRVMACVDESARKMNGTPGDSGSFDPLHELIKAQTFRLAYWRVAADDINYRRFFDVNDLAALRQENQDVFKQTHEFVLGLLREGKIDGLRIDHPDGLYNPRQYFERLQSGTEAGADCNTKPHYILAEKILSGQEQLSRDWPIDGTTGYEFANLVNGLFVDSESERSLTDAYWSFLGERPNSAELAYECKKLVMDRSLNSELNVLANHLSRIALADRHTCDFTVKSLRDALTEIVACFPVYRTYVTGQQVSALDEKYIVEAVEFAKEQASAAEASVYDFVREVLLARQREGHPEYYGKSVSHFAMRFQQYTSAVMAKGLEDTSFYRYHRLVSLNEVGGNPVEFGTSPERFHAAMRQRVEHWPDAMLATSTHDSKRSEDVRARINVLSEMPHAWRECVARWREMNRRHKRAEEIPISNDEYLLYQTLVGAWPARGEGEALPENFPERITAYMLKAVREAKEKTSWVNQNQEYESALTNFTQAVVSSQEFRRAFVPFQRVISHFGMLNSLAQTVIKLTAPGVPDIYQGNELWNFSLVDPDNRRPVNYAERVRILEELRRGSEKADCLCGFARELARNLVDGRNKAYLTWRALRLRNQNPDLFLRGDYIQLASKGAKSEHVLAFARKLGESQVVIVVPRLCARLLGGELRLPLGESVWRDTKVELAISARRSLRNVFSGERISSASTHEGTQLNVSAALANFPVAVLEAEAS